MGSGSVVNEAAFSYDGFNQMTEDAQSHIGAAGGGTPTVGYVFADGSSGNTARRTSLTYPDGRIVAFGYGTAGSLDDVLSRVADVTIQGESQAAAAYTCAGAARYVKIASPEPGTELTYFAGPGQVTPGDSGDPYVGYDRFGRTVQMRWQVSGTGALRDGYQWGYDRADNRTWRRNLAATGGGQDEAYTYDGLYQVIGDQRGTLNLNQTGIGAVPAAEENFAYDPTGNWLRYATQADGAVTLDQSRANNQANQLTQIDADSSGIAYDGAGNMTSLRPGGADGDDWDESRSLTWDAWNRLVAVSDEEETVVATYALTRRIVRTVGTEDPVHTYWSDQWKPLEERVGADTDPERQYVWGARPGHRDVLILRDRDRTGDGTLDERLYATMDYFNATGALDADGDVVERYAYSAFGARRVMAPDFTPRSASTIGWHFAFQGQFLDPETGYYDYGYRFYVPLLGRWVNRDLIQESGGVNIYSFLSNDPKNDADLLGLRQTYASKEAAAHAAGSAAVASEHAKKKTIDAGEDLAVKQKKKKKPDYYQPKEWCGRVCCKGTEPPAYYVTLLIDPVSHNCLIAMSPPCDSGDKTVSWWHSHPGRPLQDGKTMGTGGGFSGKRSGDVRDGDTDWVESNPLSRGLPLTMTRETGIGDGTYETYMYSRGSLQNIKKIGGP